MSDISNDAKHQILGNYKDWVKQFDVNDYTNNPPLIEKLHEEKQLTLSNNLDLEEKIKKLSKQLHDLELENQLYKSRFETKERLSFVSFLISLIAIILVGFGINALTASVPDKSGWVMLTAAVVLEVIAFFINYYKSNGKK